MRRESNGSYATTTVAGEKVKAFIPNPLPPSPALELEGGLRARLDEALIALGRLDGVSTQLPETPLFLYSYIRKEAVLSSQIEGTRSTLTELLLHEVAAAPGVPEDDVVEVSNYVSAMEHGLERIREGFPLSNRLLREIHGALLSGGRGQNKAPGEFRRTQNWIGGRRPGEAHFVPPPPQEVEPAMGHLERFLHLPSKELSPLVKAALAHVQFETIHPFLDGNGRVGRLLVTLILCVDGVLREPLLYLSLYLKQHRSRYYELLDRVRRDGDWEEWLEFFAQGVTETAEGAAATSKRLVSIAVEDRERIKDLGRKAGSSIHVHHALQRRPVNSSRGLSEQTKLTLPTVIKGLEVLEGLGVVRELTGKRRDRVYSYERYMNILNQGTEMR